MSKIRVLRVLNSTAVAGYADDSIANCVEDLKTFFKEGEIGAVLSFQVDYMEKEEFNNLPDFEG